MYGGLWFTQITKTQLQHWGHHVAVSELGQRQDLLAEVFPVCCVYTFTQNLLQWLGSVNEMMFSYGTFAWLWLDGCLVLYFAFSGSYCDSHFTHLTSNFSLILCTRQCFYWTLNWFQQVLIVRGLCLCFQPKLDDISQGRRAPPAGSTAAKIPPEVSFPKKYFTQWYFWLFFHSTSYLLFPENLPVPSRNETLMHHLVSLRVPF